MFRSIQRNYSSLPKLPVTCFTPQIYTGPSLEELKNIRQTRLNPALFTYYQNPLVLHQGYKQWLFDINNKRYLDMFGGICTVSVGHSHPKLVKSICDQMKKLGHVSNVYYHPKIHEYAVRLTDKFPGDLKVVYFVNSGSEANDLALLMALSYTNRSDVITIKNCYHGMTCQTMGLTSMSLYKYPVGLSNNVYTVACPDVFKGFWGGRQCRDSPVQASRSCQCSGNCEATDKYLEEFNDVFKCRIRKGNLAAFFAESIQGVGGTVQFPKGYIKGVRKIVKENGGLFIADEVQTGFGRTGEHFWGFQMHGVQPDIVTLAKGIGNGFPLAAVVTTPEISKSLTKAHHFNTFGGNPVACAAGLSVLDIIEDEQLQQNSLAIGTYLMEELEKLKYNHKIVGDVRGKGLMIGVELVQGDGSTAPLHAQVFMEIWENCRNRGLLLGKGGIDGNVLRIKPPMCITKDDANFTIQTLTEVLSKFK